MAAAYTIHCQLALVYVKNLQTLVRDGKISLLAFYKGTCEATCTIRQVNGLQGTAVFLQTIWLLIRTLSSMVSFVFFPSPSAFSPVARCPDLIHNNEVIVDAMQYSSGQ